MADKILYNGKIYTENPAMPWITAIAIEGKIICYAGDDETALKLAESDTEFIDLEGKMVIPSFIDGHTHPPTVSKTYWSIQGPLTYDKDELYANIAKAAEDFPKEKRPYFYYENYFTETFGTEGPNRWELDRIISDRPARIQDFGDHACCYNSIALDMLKNENGVPVSISPIGTPEFIKNEDGEYTGWCLESLVDGDEGIYEATGWKPETVMCDEISKPLLDYFKQYGVTAIFDALMEEEEDLKYIYNLDKEGKLGLFYDCAYVLVEPDQIDSVISTVRDWQEKYTTEHVRINTVKFFIDGTNEMGDCLSTEPFKNDPSGDNYGEAYASMEDMRDIIVRLNAEKLDFHVHTICDGAFRLMCDAVEEAMKICGGSLDIKVTLAHCELIHPDDVKRVKELGIYIDSTLHWTGGYFGEGAVPYLGQERWNTMHDLRKVIADGGKVGFSSDLYAYSEANRADPMIGMQIAMTRVDPRVPLDPEKYPGSVRPPYSAKYRIEELIHGYTKVNAERMRLDDKLGSIEKGKLANFTVFGVDIFEAAYSCPETFSSIDPEYTYFEGEKKTVISEMKKNI